MKGKVYLVRMEPSQERIAQKVFMEHFARYLVRYKICCLNSFGPHHITCYIQKIGSCFNYVVY